MAANLLLLNGLPDSRQASRETLERAGYRVIEAQALDEAIHSAHDEPVRAIIVDASGGRDGALRHVTALRRHPATFGVPILVLDPEESDLRSAVAGLKSVGWLREPCSPRQLLEELQYLTTPARSRPGFPAEPPTEERPSTSGTPLQWVDERTRRPLRDPDPDAPHGRRRS